MTGRRARVTLSHRWCAWCGETIEPPGFIRTEQKWSEWSAQFCSDQCAEDHKWDVWREAWQRARILKKGAPA
jgi:predicted nucleic acid-binding Zn ribbon protein